MNFQFFFTSFLLLSSSFHPISSLNIALHSQARYAEHGWVAGSEITTAGIKRALEQLKDTNHHVQVFAPFSYLGLHDVIWDLVIIEGYIGSVPTFVRRMRKLNPTVKILHYCLDTYPTLDHIMALDVDGYLTNSRVLLPKLSKLAPTKYVPLAADPFTMSPTKGNKYLNHTIVYLGHNSPGKPTLHRMLREALEYGLIIYGHKWADAPSDLKARWRGVLPLNDVAELYSSADIVIGTTEGKQQRLGMINNRVYETLGCGSVLISDSFDMIEQEFGNLVYFDKNPGDTSRIVRRLLKTKEGRKELQERGQQGRQRVVERESWSHRVVTMLELYQSLQFVTLRPQRPKVLIVGILLEQWMQNSFQTAHSTEFRMTHIIDFDTVQDKDLVSTYDIVVVVGQTSDLKFRNRMKLGMDLSSLLRNTDSTSHHKDVRRDQHGMLCRKLYIELIDEDIHKNEDMFYDVVVPKKDRDATSLIHHMVASLTAARRSASATLTPSFDNVQFRAGDVVRFEVKLLNFVAPDHGMWCVRVNEEEIRCVGDSQASVDLIVPNTSKMVVQAVLRTHMDRTVFKLESPTEYKVVQMVEEIIVVNGVTETIQAYDDRKLFKTVSNFCHDHELNRDNYRQILNRILKKAPNAAQWRQRTDGMLRVGYVVRMDRMEDIEIRQMIETLEKIDSVLYDVIVLVIGIKELDRNEIWVQLLTEMQIGVVNLKIPDLLAEIVEKEINDSNNNNSNGMVLGAETYNMIQQIINVLRGLDVIEFIGTNTSRSRNDQVVIVAASSIDVVVVPIGVKGNEKIWSTMTNAATYLKDGVLKIPKIAGDTVFERDKSAVIYFQKAQDLTGELLFDIGKQQDSIDLLAPDRTHLLQALPLFERRLRFHRGVPINEWMTSVDWVDWGDNTSHNKMVEQILQYRYQSTVSHIIRKGPETWKTAQVGGFTYPKVTGWWPGEYKSRGNFYVTAKHKLLHDAAQFRYNVEKGYLPNIFLKVAANYTIASDVLMAGKKMNQYLFMDRQFFDLIGTTYNWLNYKHILPIIHSGALFQGSTNFQKAEEEYFSKERAPGLAVIDNFLSKKALSSILEYLRASSIWYDVKNGYLGTYMNTGLTGPLLGQIEKEIRQRMPKLIGKHPLRTIWGEYK